VERADLGGHPFNLLWRDLFGDSRPQQPKPFIRGVDSQLGLGEFAGDLEARLA